MVPTKVVGRGWAGRRRGVGLAVERAMVPTKVVGRGVGSAVPQVVHGWGGRAGRGNVHAATPWVAWRGTAVVVGRHGRRRRATAMAVIAGGW